MQLHHQTRVLHVVDRYFFHARLDRMETEKKVENFKISTPAPNPRSCKPYAACPKTHSLLLTRGRASNPAYGSCCRSLETARLSATQVCCFGIYDSCGLSRADLPEPPSPDVTLPSPNLHLPAISLRGFHCFLCPSLLWLTFAALSSHTAWFLWTYVLPDSLR